MLLLVIGIMLMLWELCFEVLIGVIIMFVVVVWLCVNVCMCGFVIWVLFVNGVGYVGYLVVMLVC